MLYLLAFTKWDVGGTDAEKDTLVAAHTCTQMRARSIKSKSILAFYRSQIYIDFGQTEDSSSHTLIRHVVCAFSFGLMHKMPNKTIDV